MSKKLIVMVSSSVYGAEELLDRVYALLTAFGYEVWMSHKGTVPVQSNQTAFESCLAAVEKCDLFLGLLMPQYGSGVDSSGFSITHREMQKAIKLDKPRWFLAHDHVVLARRLLIDLGYKTAAERDSLCLKRNAMSIGSLKVIDMYEDATMEHLLLDDRQGNWVQKFDRNDDAQLFLVAQFSRYQDIEMHLQEQFSQEAQLRARLNDGARGDDDV